jgi:hypothetical protein
MRVSSLIFVLVLAGPSALITSEARADRGTDKAKAQCANYGFQEGSDAFANCVMKLAQRQKRENPDRETLLRRYRDLSMTRRGDDRYPVCSAAMMDNVLDINSGKWVGPNCQMAPD